MTESEHRERRARSGPSSGSFKIARVEVQELAALAGPEGLPGAADLLSDELLVDRLLLGETQHFDVLLRRTAARLYRIARGISGSPVRAEDLVRDAFVLAYQSLASYDRRLRVSDWLSRIVIHGALATLHSEGPMPRVALPSQRELVRQLEDAVDALPDAFRVAFTLCVLDNMPPVDVARALGLTPSDVQVSAFRGRLRVRRRIGMRFDDAEARAFGLDLARLDDIARKAHARLGLKLGSTPPGPLG